MLISAIDLGSLDNQEKTLLYYQLAASYASHPPDPSTENDALHLVTALTFIDTFALDSPPSSHLKGQILSAKLKWQPQIQKIFQSERGGELCTEISKTVLKDIAVDQWDCKTAYPVCSSANGIYKLDVESGTLSVKEGTISGLPARILNHPSFPKQLYPPGALCECQNGIYRFLDANKTQTEVYWDNGTVSVIQDLKGWGKHQLVPHSDMQSDFKNGMRHLFDRHTVWLPTDPQAQPHALFRDENNQITHQLLFEVRAEIQREDKEVIRNLISSNFIGERREMLEWMLEQESLSEQDQKYIIEISEDIESYVERVKVRKNKIVSIPEIKRVLDYFRKSASDFSTGRVVNCVKLDDPSGQMHLVDTFSHKTSLPPEVGFESLLWKDNKKNELTLEKCPLTGLHLTSKEKEEG